MKTYNNKILALLLSIVLLCSVPLSANANTIVSAESVLEGENHIFIFSSENDKHWYKFTATESAYYDAVLSFEPLTDDIINSATFWIYDEDGNFIDNSYTAIKKNGINNCEFQYQKGKTYYYEIDCSADGNSTFTINKHTHSLYWGEIDKASMSYDGYKMQECSECSYSKKVIIPRVSTIKLSKNKFVYDGKNHKPTVTVKDRTGKILSEGTDYWVNYNDSNTKDVGPYDLSVFLIGNYDDAEFVYYNVVPKSTTINNVTAKKKAFTVKWKKQAKQITGYQIQYSTDRSFKKNKKTVTVKGAKKTSYTIKKLKGNKKYYVRIRTYNSEYTKLYSSWSKVKTVKTKK